MKAETAVVYRLSNEKKIPLVWLRKRELDQLLNVPTTVEQAEQVIKRNEALLKKLDEADESKVPIPCPHCSDKFDCEHCAWNLLYVADSDYKCLNAVFSGVSDRDSGVNLYSDSADIDPSVFNSEESGLKCEAYLQGHIEWAQAVIILGGVPWPEKTPPLRLQRDQ